MARNKKGIKIDGWLNLDKPQGLTSTQAIGKVRRLLNAQKLGHAGTLDPLATGVLPIALGEATKTIPFVQDSEKAYAFTITWGVQTDTDDSEGDEIDRSDNIPTQEDIEAALPAFIGEIEQIPPQYSAVKIDGQRAYDLARKGETVKIKSRIVTITELKLIDWPSETQTRFTMTCGKGTYVRSVARDLAQKLDTCGHISQLRRTRTGVFPEKEAISLDKLEEIIDKSGSDAALYHLDYVLDDIPALDVSRDEAKTIRNGQALDFISRGDFARLEAEGLGTQEEQLVVLYHGEEPIGLAENKGAKTKPVRLFNLNET